MGWENQVFKGQKILMLIVSGCYHLRYCMLAMSVAESAWART